jgi:hypothetical protein
MYEMQIETGKLSEFARAVHAPSPDEGQPAIAMTPTFLSTASHFWEPEGSDSIAALGFDKARVLHGEESFAFFGAPCAVGTTLRVETRLGEQYERVGRRGGRMRFGTVIRSFTDADGRLVAEQRTILIETSPRTERDGA